MDYQFTQHLQTFSKDVNTYNTIAEAIPKMTDPKLGIEDQEDIFQKYFDTLLPKLLDMIAELKKILH